MRARYFSVCSNSINIVLALCPLVADAGRVIPRALPAHPGNIFLAGESIVIPEPPGAGTNWHALNYENQVVARGVLKDGKADAGVLPVGWYKIVRGEGHITNRVSIGVLEPLRAPTPLTSPIGMDVAMAWIFPEPQWPDVINLCQLAGMNRVRDRISWPDLEPKRGEFAAQTRYDGSLRAQTGAGLQVLDVNHICPPWANSNSMHFPTDLRDVYNSYRVFAQRWRGQMEAFEPWNEADIKDFGGHMGSEMATMQKAAWLGLKAGNPDLTVCQNVFAIHRLATLHDFQDNKAWPYFDKFDLHHYDQFQDYPRMFREFRAVSAGKPIWVTECNVIVPWKDEKTKEPSEADLRIQSERVPMIYSLDIYEGAAAVFYFMLPHYVEYKRQYGLLRPDFTPRPAYVAAAAAGRFLADAMPMGRVQSASQDLQGYVFNAKPDGRPARVLVIWSATNTTFSLPAPPDACFDHLGRPHSVSGNILNVGRAPQYFELTKAACPVLVPPPAATKLLTGRADPVVIQALLPVHDIILNESAARMPDGTNMSVPVFVYNFSQKAMRGKLKVTVPEHWTAELQREITLAPGAREELTLHLTHPQIAGLTNQPIRIQGKFNHGGGSPLLSFRLTATEK